MKFYNVCSGLCFTVSHDDIKTVVLRSANDEPLAGKLRIQFTTVDGKEVPIVQSIVAPRSSVVTVEAPNGGTFIPGKKYYILTIPQSLPNGLIIEGFRADGKVYTYTVDKSVTLKRSVFARKKNFDAGLTPEDLYDYTLSVTPPDVFTYAGGSGNMRILSIRTLKSDPTKVFNVTWKMQISTDGGTIWNDLTKDNKSNYGADWFNPTLSIYSSSINFSPLVLTVDMAERVTVDDIEAVQTSALKNGKHPSGIDNSTKANAIDLSMYDLLGNPISQTTANCYIVSAPGWYKFPIVYGNAIKNGTTNTNAFVSSAAQVDNGKGEDAILTNFVDHNGANITQPWVTNAHSGGAYYISKAELVWQDEPNLVTNITVGNSGSNRDQNVIYDFLPVNLGWSDEEGTGVGYLARMADMRIFQTISSQTADCDIVQKGYVESMIGNNPFYQWGRKDPMLPGGEVIFDPVAITTSTTNKTWYDRHGVSYDNLITEELSDNSIKGIDAIKNFIKNPFIFNLTYFMDGQFYNLWSANDNIASENDNIVVKTVYDPSPIGYSVPAPNAFTGFSTIGDVTHDLSEFNVTGSYHNGWDFNTNLANPSTIFIPATGFRATYSSTRLGEYANKSWGAAMERREYFEYQLSGTCENYPTHNLSVSGTSDVYFAPFHLHSRDMGRAVRPVQEK